MSKCWSEKNVQNVPANRTKVFLSEVYRPKSLSPNIFVANVRLFLCLSLVRTKVHLLVGLKESCELVNPITTVTSTTTGNCIALIVMQHVFLDVWFT